MAKLVLNISNAESEQNKITIFCITIHFSLQTVKLCAPELQFLRIEIINKVSKG